MPRYTPTQFFMTLALVVILALFIPAERGGQRFTKIKCLSFSSDGSRIAVSKLNARDSQTPHKLYLADVSRTLSLIATLEGQSMGIVHQDLKAGNRGPSSMLWWRGRSSAIFNPMNDHIVASEFGGGNIVEFAPDTQSELVVTRLDHRALNLAISKSGKLLVASGLFEHTICSTTTHHAIMDLQSKSRPFWKAEMLAFSNDETKIIAATGRDVLVWDIASRTESLINLEEFGESWVYAIGVLPDNTLLICSNRWVRRYDISGDIVSTITESGPCFACCISNNGHVALIMDDGKLATYDLESGKKTDLTYPDYVTAMAFSPDGQSLAVGNRSGTVSLIDIGTGKPRWTMRPPGRYRWPWTWPATSFVAWALIAWVLWTKKRNKRTGSVI